MHKFPQRQYAYILQEGEEEENQSKPHKKPKQDMTEKTNNPIIMQGLTVFFVVKSSSNKIKKFLMDVCDYVSKPQSIHEYKLSSTSLLRAEQLGYTKAMVLKTFNQNIKNETIPQLARDLIESKMTGIKSELYLVFDNDKCYYRFVTLESEFQKVKKQIEGLLTYVKTEKREEKDYLIFKVLEHKNNEISKVFFEKKIALRAARELTSFEVEDISKFKNRLSPTYCHDITIHLKSFTQLREYQTEALNSIVHLEGSNLVAKNGYIVLPCGAGKTLLGISIISKIKKEALIICSSDSGADQWKREIEKWTQGFPRDQIVILTSSSEYSFQNSKVGQIFISTYSSLKSKVARESKLENKWIKVKPWGLIIFDECQTLPAQENREIVAYLNAQVKIGLTATPMREDDEIETLNYMIGPQLYIGNWKDFVDLGYLANPKCIEIRTSLTKKFRAKYDSFRNDRERREMCYKINPNKIKALLFLLECHEELNDHTLVFSDDIAILKYVAAKIKRPILIGDTRVEIRNILFDLFREGIIKTLFLSRIGDEAIDLPNANVAIELNIQHGSRKQMLQRLGRIMRQKAASSSMSYNAMFYTITTVDTEEWRYFFKRYKCLMDEGFSYDLRLFEYSERPEIQNILNDDPIIKEKVEMTYRSVVGDEEAYWQNFIENKVN